MEEINVLTERAASLLDIDFLIELQNIINESNS